LSSVDRIIVGAASPTYSTRSFQITAFLNLNTSYLKPAILFYNGQPTTDNRQFI
jgi:hypothetical protein